MRLTEAIANYREAEAQLNKASADLGRAAFNSANRRRTSGSVMELLPKRWEGNRRLYEKATMLNMEEVAERRRNEKG